PAPEFSLAVPGDEVSLPADLLAGALPGVGASVGGFVVFSPVPECSLAVFGDVSLPTDLDVSLGLVFDDSAPVDFAVLPVSGGVSFWVFPLPSVLPPVWPVSFFPADPLSVLAVPAADVLLPDEAEATVFDPAGSVLASFGLLASFSPPVASVFPSARLV